MAWERLGGQMGQGRRGRSKGGWEDLDSPGGAGGTDGLRKSGKMGWPRGDWNGYNTANGKLFTNSHRKDSECLIDGQIAKSECLI